MSESRSDYIEDRTESFVEEIDERSLGKRVFESLAFENLILAEHGELKPLSNIEAGLNEAIIGQPEAIESLISALHREKLRNPNRPIANLLFLGPTGVGKSETAKELANLLHEDGKGFLKIDCSSYSRGHEIATLVGAPPGYVGHEKKPLFDKEIIERDKSVILFDELEKGSQPLWDLMLQIMDDGEVTIQSTGETVSFKNSIIIMTSNLGASEIMNTLSDKKIGFQTTKGMEVNKKSVDEAANKALKEQFRPEFINRFDKRVVFSPLDDEKLGKVLDRYVEDANERYQKAGILLAMSPKLRNEIVASCDERSHFGARPILRRYDQLVESLLGEHLSSGGIPERSWVYAVSSKEIPGEKDDSSIGVRFFYEPDENFDEDDSALDLSDKSSNMPQTELTTREKVKAAARIAGLLAARLAQSTADQLNNRLAKPD